MSKSLGNHIGITEPPGDMYGKTLSLPDAALPEWYDLLLGEPVPPDAGPRCVAFGSPPPIFAATMIALESLLQSLPRRLSISAFLCLMPAQ